MPYTPTNWINDAPPPLSAANLNKLTDELQAQAATKAVANTLPNWVDGASPALTDAVPLNEMERVIQAVAASLGLTYVPASWSAGWTPARNAAAFNRMEAAVAANRAAMDATAGQGVQRARFTDFYTQWGYSASDHNGQIFQSRWSPVGLQTMSSPQNPWPSLGGPAISEITDHLGRPGFRFRCNPEMVASSGGKKTEIFEANGAWPGVNPYGDSMIRGIGYTDEISFVVRFPAAGNPNGFPGPNEGAYDRRNVLWQHSMDPSELNYFGISRLGFTNRFYLSVGRHIGLNSENFAVTLPWEVGFDQDYNFRYIINWQSNTTGSFQWWVKRETDSAEVQYANYSGQTWWATPNTEFGFYTAEFLSNEVLISDIRVTPH